VHPYHSWTMARKASLITKRSIQISGRSTSVSLEDSFWSALKEIAATKHVHVRELVSMIDSERRCSNLSSTIRLFVLNYYRGQV